MMVTMRIRQLRSQPPSSKDPAIVGVIGHGTSATTLAAAPIYQQGQIPMIAPTSTSTELATLPREGSNFIFRVIPSDQFSGTSLVRHMLSAGKTRPIVFYNSESSYSKSLQEALSTTLSLEGGGRSPNWWICPRATHRLNWRRVEPMRLFCCRILPPLTRPLRWLRPTRNNSPSGRGTPSTALKLWKKGGASLNQHYSRRTLASSKSGS